MKKRIKKAIIDVSHPDDTVPSETSRPVIIANRPIMKDPMMAVDDSDEKKILKPQPKMTQEIPTRLR